MKLSAIPLLFGPLLSTSQAEGEGAKRPSSSNPVSRSKIPEPLQGLILEGLSTCWEWCVPRFPEAVHVIDIPIPFIQLNKNHGN